MHQRVYGFSLYLDEPDNLLVTSYVVGQVDQHITVVFYFFIAVPFVGLHNNDMLCI